jgi:hypothetical protein
MAGSRPSLSVLVLTHDARLGLPRLLAEVSGLADEIVVGVDSTASDETLEAAVAGADVVFRFEHTGPPILARLPALDYASCDWVLALDHDEGIDRALAALIPELLATDRYSHYHFPRKWIVELDPPQYLYGPPWFPDWQLRLFVNDRTRVWHSGRMHSGYRVLGAGSHDERGAILHYEPVVLDDGARAAKLESYRNRFASLGGAGFERFYGPVQGPQRRIETPPAAAVSGRVERGRLAERICRVRSSPSRPAWRAALDPRVPATLIAGEPFLIDVLAQNCGRLAWTPHAEGWPRLSLSCHWRDAEGKVLEWDGPRYPVSRDIAPGEGARFLGVAVAPAEPGRYCLEWDIVSEGDLWFSELGSTTAPAQVRVVAAEGPNAASAAPAAEPA